MIKIMIKKSNPFVCEESRKNQTTAQACITEKYLESRVFHDSEGKHVSDVKRFLLPAENCGEHTINTF